MKVKELVEQLLKLDQEKDIWVLYDCLYPQIPGFEPSKEDLKCIKAGDYVHNAW